MIGRVSIKEAALQYCFSCMSFDGVSAMISGQEGHGGSTFCRGASLELMDKLQNMHASSQKDLIHWCVSRQVSGLRGQLICGRLRFLGQEEFC